MPTETEWKEESFMDPDIAYLIQKIKANEVVSYVTLDNKGYYKQWTASKLEVEYDILYQYEHPKATNSRQLKRCVVPVSLRQLIYTAYHATPLAGHVGVYKTYWRIAARYYWPGIYNDIRKAVVECGHCILGNNDVSHQNQQILGKLDYDEPFDIICPDIYVPGRTGLKGHYKSMSILDVQQAAVTSLCNMTAFVTAGFLQHPDSKTVAEVIFTQVLLPNGIPKMVLLDQGSL
jgi:hypothetical protein